MSRVYHAILLYHTANHKWGLSNDIKFPESAKRVCSIFVPLQLLVGKAPSNLSITKKPVAVLHLSIFLVISKEKICVAGILLNTNLAWCSTGWNFIWWLNCRLHKGSPRKLKMEIVLSIAGMSHRALERSFCLQYLNSSSAFFAYWAYCKSIGRHDLRLKCGLYIHSEIFPGIYEL